MFVTVNSFISFSQLCKYLIAKILNMREIVKLSFDTFNTVVRTL